MNRLTQPGLLESEFPSEPMDQFRRWYDAAGAAGEPEPEAMAVATADPAGVPSVRYVLLRGLDDRGFVFYTNERSRKGQQLGANPAAAAVFRWWRMERQVRVAGPVERVTPAESDAYFAARPRGAQISAWASRQSERVGSRQALEDAHHEEERRFEGQEVPRPPWWGGFRILPEEIEFWQGRPDRLHDRLRYRKAPGGSWELERLAP